MKKFTVIVFMFIPFIIIAQEDSTNFKIDSDAWLRRFPTDISNEYSGVNKSTATPVDFIQDYILVKDDGNKFAFVDRKSTNYDYVDANNLLKKNYDKNDSYYKIYIHAIYIGEINSAGGVSLIIEWYYFNPYKDIKYIDFYLTPYNAVGDKISCDITHKSFINCQRTGPITAEKFVNDDYYENVIYNSTAMCFKLNKVVVQYMDNSIHTFINNINKIISPNLKYCCF